jgi:mono/diheme cytochrome c family protein
LSGSLDRAALRKAAGSNQIDLHRVVDSQKQCARVLHSPFRVGHGKVHGCRPAVDEHLDLRRYLNFAIHSVDAKYSMHPHRRLSRRRDCAGHTIRLKRNLRIALALEHLPMHFAVAHAAAALAALGIDYDLAGELSCRAIELQRATFQAKCSVNRMQHIAESEFYRSSRRVELQGENAIWLDPKPRDFTMAIFKCRSTLTGTLPTDEDLFNTIGRGLTNSNMPIWNVFSNQQRADLVAFIKTFSPRWQKEKAGDPIKIPPEPAVTIESISHGKALFTKLECWKCHGPEGKGDGPSASTLTDSKDNPIRPYDFAAGKNDSRFKCGSTNADVYKIFITGVDGTPMPSFADVIQPNDAWDLVHFLRTLQVNRHSKENDVLKAAGGKIPPYVEKQAEAPSAPPESKPAGGGN